MAYTVTQLITNAYYLSGIVSREFETVQGYQLSDGLQFLNELIADKTVDKSAIPYDTTGSFTAIIGQEQYDIDNLISLDTLTFEISSVRYPVYSVERSPYFGTWRANDINSLPYKYHLERKLGGASIFLYFKPVDTYVFTMWGKFRLSSVTNNQDLSLTLDQFYINYLRYELADRLCSEFNMTVPKGVEKQLAVYQSLIDKKSAKLDLSVRRISVLDDTQNSINYAQVNFGNGWEP